MPALCDVTRPVSGSPSLSRWIGLALFGPRFWVRHRQARALTSLSPACESAAWVGCRGALELRHEITGAGVSLWSESLRSEVPVTTGSLPG